MKFTLNSSELLALLQVVGSAISSNPVLPILEDFIFSIKDRILTIKATDLEVTIIRTMEVMSGDDGQVAIPAKILLETLKALPTQPITFKVEAETFAIEITSAYGKYKLAGESANDFPRNPVLDESATMTIPAPLLLKGIENALFATSNDELRPAMTGVLFQVEHTSLVMVATDAHKLVKCVIKDIENESATKFIVPKKGLNILKSTLAKEKESIEVVFNKANVNFKFGDMELVCRLVDARYPDYTAVIPTDNPNELVVVRADFQSSLKRIAIYANKTTNQVILNIKDGDLTVSAQDLDFSNEATEQLHCTFNGDPMNIGFNAKFLAGMLGVLDSEKVRLNLSGPTRAGILVPVVDSEEMENFEVMQLCMPVMLSN